MEEAIAWLKRCPNPMTDDSKVEIRPIFSPEDVEAITQELRQQEERERAEIAATAKHQPRRMDMRFISICTLNPTNRLPTEAEMASMHKLIVEGMKAGWLLECEGVQFGANGVRVHKAAGGEVTVTDGPFAETKEVLGGYALLNAATKEEAVEHTRRFLDQLGQGTCEGTWEGAWETYQLFEIPTGEGQ